ncbi:hypothetical protein ACFSTC_46645 [Nonomuraea ferruginea]
MTGRARSLLAAATGAALLLTGTGVPSAQAEHAVRAGLHGAGLHGGGPGGRVRARPRRRGGQGDAQTEGPGHGRARHRLDPAAGQAAAPGHVRPQARLGHRHREVDRRPPATRRARGG